MVTLEVDHSLFTAPGNPNCRLGNLGQESPDRPQSLFESYPNCVGNLQVDCGRRFAAASRKHLFTFNGRVCGRSYNRDVLGAVTGFSRLSRELLDPLFQSLRSIPSMAWVPLFILWLGINESSKISLIALGIFFPVYLNLMNGVQNVDRKLVEVGLVAGFRGAELVWRIILPASLPAYLVGLRQGLALGWMFVVAAEIMGASRGLGYLLIDGEATGRPAIMIASVILFGICGKLTDSLLVTLSARLLRWQDVYRG